MPNELTGEALRARVNKGLAATIGIEVSTLRDDLVIATMPVNENTRQPFGILHGGASAALAETVASLGAYMNVDPDTQAAVGVELNANHISAKRDGIVTATATPVQRGRTIHVWDIRIEDENKKLVCVSRCTLAIVSKR